MSIVRITASANHVELFCYSGGFNTTYESELEFCHHYRFEISGEELRNFQPEDYAESSSVFVDSLHRKIFLTNDWTGDEKDFEYQSFEELDRPVEIVLIKKIQHLKLSYEVEYNNSTRAHLKLQEVSKFLNKEIDVEARKIDFFKFEKNVEKLNQTIGKIEVARKIEEMLKKKAT